MNCWNCQKPAAGGGPFCPACGAIQPPAPNGAQDYFAILGVPRSFQLDDEQLEERYRALQRTLHPDRFAKASPRERLFSVQQTTNVNEAYRVLRDPVRRAEYLLRLAGVDLDDERAGAGDKVAPGFLVEIMELREELAAAKESGDAGRLQALTADVAARRDRALAAMRDGFTQGTGDGLSAAEAKALASHLVALRYYRRFLDEAESRPAEL